MISPDDERVSIDMQSNSIWVYFRLSEPCTCSFISLGDDPSKSSLLNGKTACMTPAWRLHDGDRILTFPSFRTSPTTSTWRVKMRTRDSAVAPSPLPQTNPLPASPNSSRRHRTEAGDGSSSLRHLSSTSLSTAFATPTVWCWWRYSTLV